MCVTAFSKERTRGLRRLGHADDTVPSLGFPLSPFACTRARTPTRCARKEFLHLPLLLAAARRSAGPLRQLVPALGHVDVLLRLGVGAADFKCEVLASAARRGALHLCEQRGESARARRERANEAGGEGERGRECRCVSATACARRPARARANAREWRNEARRQANALQRHARLNLLPRLIKRVQNAHPRGYHLDLDAVDFLEVLDELLERHRAGELDAVPRRPRPLRAVRAMHDGFARKRRSAREEGQRKVEEVRRERSKLETLEVRANNKRI